MPWKTSGPVDQRVQFIAAAQGDPAEPFSVLCARFEISRKTGYKQCRSDNHRALFGR